MTSGRGLLKGCGLRGRGFIGVLVWWGLLLLGWIGRGLARVRFPGASRRNLRWSGLPPEGWGGVEGGGGVVPRDGAALGGRGFLHCPGRGVRAGQGRVGWAPCKVGPRAVGGARLVRGQGVAGARGRCPFPDGGVPQGRPLARSCG